MKLAVLQFNSLTGWLESTPDRGIIFQYDSAYINRPGARALSFSLPLQEIPFSQSRALPFFAGLLPDGEVRRRIADQLHVSENSTIRLLEALGGECAGTVSLIPATGADEVGSVTEESYEEIQDEQLTKIIQDADRLPLLISGTGARRLAYSLIKSTRRMEVPVSRISSG